ncbi:MAG: hypothetical protein P8J33_04960 [Pirellulaceae bacterium]|nr:hypothetical protein [Pirellulaceae bacterium]
MLPKIVAPVRSLPIYQTGFQTRRPITLGAKENNSRLAVCLGRRPNAIGFCQLRQVKVTNRS